MTGRELLRTQPGALLPRLWRFVHKPWREQLSFLKLRCVRILLSVPIPIRLPFGAWWLAESDACGTSVFLGRFEIAERLFVERFLRPGMNVLDIGAHHGFYTLLASQKVSPTGRVVAFEPSPREYRKLLRHLRLNGCDNVRARNCALGSREGKAELFLVEGRETGCNSLRPPNAGEPTKTVPASVSTLDSCLKQEKVDQVDFIKLDVEGAEMEVLQGAEELLARLPRPVFLCEVQDVRCRPWGYEAREIILLLERLGYDWFLPTVTGGLEPVCAGETRFNGNFVAVPIERLYDTDCFGQMLR